MASLLYQLSSVGKEYSYPRRHMKKLRLYEAIGPARNDWVALSSKVTKYASDHHEEITRGIKRPEGYSISFFMAGSKPSTARPTILISSLNKSERRAVKRVIESLKALAEYPNIAVECVDGSVAMLHADSDLPYNVPRNPAHEVFVEGRKTLCGARVVAGNSLATLGGVIYLNDGKTITPFGLTVFHAGSGIERAREDQPEDEMVEFAFDDSSDEEEDEDLFENRSRSLSTSQTDADTDETTRSRSITESVNLEPMQVAEYLPQEPILSPPDTTNDDRETSDGGPLNGLDYQLVSLSGIVCPENMLRIPLQAPIQPKFVAKGAKDVGVWAATSTTPPVRGRLSICPYLLKLPTYSLQKLWVVDLERDIRLGDSGAWIIDESSNVYGHIVAATPGSFRAYILPLHQIFEDIEVFTKCKPSLLSPSEIASKGGIGKPVVIIPYSSGEGKPSGNESNKTEELSSRDLQNEAHNSWGINILGNPIKPLNTTELASVDKPAPAGENLPQPTNPKVTTEREQNTQDKSESPDKIEIQGRPRQSIIIASHSSSGTSSESDSPGWDDIDALESASRFRDNETVATTVSSSTATANKKVKEPPTVIRAHRPRSRSPSRERRSVAFEDYPSYSNPTLGRTRPASYIPPPMRHKSQEPSYNPFAPINLEGSGVPIDNNQYSSYSYVPQGQQAPEMPIPPRMPGYPPDAVYSTARAFADSLFAHTRQNPDQPVRQSVVPGVKSREVGQRNTVPQDRVAADELRRQLPIGVDERRDLDAARRDLNDAWRDLDDARRDLDDARRDLDPLRNSYGRDRFDRYSRMDEDVIMRMGPRDLVRRDRRFAIVDDDFPGVRQEDILREEILREEIRREEIRREEKRRPEMEAHRDKARSLETEIHLEQEKLRYLESRSRAPTESSGPGNRDQRLSELEHDLKYERQKTTLLNLEAKHANLRQVESDLKHVKELEELKYEMKCLNEQQQVSTGRPIEITARRPPTDSYDFNSARASSNAFGEQPRNVEDPLDFMRKRERNIVPDIPRRSSSLDKTDRNRIAATLYNREEDMDYYLRRPRLRGTYEELDRRIPPRIYSQHEHRNAMFPTPPPS